MRRLEAFSQKVVNRQTNNRELLFALESLYKEIITTVSEDYIATVYDEVIQVTQADVTITLPTPVDNLGEAFSVNNISNGDIKVISESGLINEEQYQIVPPKSTMQVYSDNENYWIY